MTNRFRKWRAVGASLCAALMVGCQTKLNRPPITLTPKVDIPRFMGNWYVIANIPTFIEKGAHNAVESYRQDSDGTIATTFTFRAGAFEGKAKRYTPRGFVQDATGAIWGMRFVWPFKSDFRIVHLSDDYSQAIIGRQARDYVWIMARAPTLSESDYQRMVDLVAAEGYDISKLKRVPQRW